MLEYLAARAASTSVSAMEETVTIMLFCCLRCPSTEQICSSYLQERGEQDRNKLGYFETQVHVFDFAFLRALINVCSGAGSR